MMKNFSATSFILGCMVGALLVAGWFFGGDGIRSSGFSSSLFATSTLDISSQETSGAVSVGTQPAGDVVHIESVTVPPPGVWAAVVEVNGRDLGNVLGATRVVGPHSNVEVSLLRPTEPDRTYAIELYRDDNNGSFAPAENSVYVDFDTGTRVVVYFTTAGAQ